MFFFLRDFIDFSKSVHIKLSDEAFNLLVPKIGWQDNILHFLVILDMDFTAIASPRDDVLELLFLEDDVEFENEVRYFFVSKLLKIDSCLHLNYKEVKERTLKLGFKF